ncbi:O-antigen ligase [Micromonospora zamorensis]|nr:O-antigen ligase [Micromonospora zamorensis]
MAAATSPVAPNTLLWHGAWLATVVLLRIDRLRPLDIAVFALPLWATAASIDNLRLPHTEAAIRSYWGMAVLFVLARVAIRSRFDIALVSGAYLAGSLYAAVLTIRRSEELRQEVYQLGAPAIRAGLNGVNPNYTAYALATAVAVGLALLSLRYLPRRWHLMVWAALPVFGWAIFLTGTRGAQVAVGLAAMYAAVSRLAPTVAWRAASIGSAVALIVVPSGVYGDERLLSLQSFFTRQDDTLSGRLVVWEFARSMWQDHWFTGIGAGMFPVADPFGIGAHSVVLTLFVELGVMGTLLYAAVWCSAMVNTARSSSDGRRAVGLLLVTWLPIWLSGHWELSPAAWVVLGVWSRVQGRERRGAGRVRDGQGFGTLSGHSRGGLPSSSACSPSWPSTRRTSSANAPWPASPPPAPADATVAGSRR